MKRILVPCDFSIAAQEAFKFAVTIAEKNQGEVHVLYVLDITFLRGNPSLSHNYAFNLNFLKDMEQEADKKFKSMWEQYAPMTLPVKFRHNIGSLIPDIQHYIGEHNIDLVIMGTHGISESSWGTNTEKLVRHSPIPMIAVRKAPAMPIKNIVFPVIPEQPDKKLVTAVQDLQKFFDAHVHLLWVNTPQIFKSDADCLMDIQRYATDFDFNNYSINTCSDYQVENGIFRFAKETNADMVAMGTHAWKGLAHLFNGSIAEEIVNHINIPIWTYTIR